MRKIFVAVLLFMGFFSCGCKGMFSFTTSTTCAENPSETSPSSNCQGPPGYDSLSPPVFYRFHRLTDQNVFAFDSYLEVALVGKEPKPPRGQFFLVLLPDEDPEIVYSAKVRMTTSSGIPDLQADISAWASPDGYNTAEPLGKTSLRNGSEVTFPDYSRGQKYKVKSSFRWIVFTATYRSAYASQVPADSRAQIYMGYGW